MFGWLDNLSDGAAIFLGAFTGTIGGLLAILLGALYNGHLNRKRDDRLLRQDAEALAVALREELQVIHRALLQNAEAWQKPGDRFIGADLAHLIKVLPHVLPKLGLLSKEAVATVIAAYSLIEHHGETLLLLGAKAQKLSSGRLVYLLRPADTSRAAQLNENVAKAVQKAVDVLSNQIAD
jgi:glycerol-3-phosphate responsive antiterminator